MQAQNKLMHVALFMDFSLPSSGLTIKGGSKRAYDGRTTSFPEIWY